MEERLGEKKGDTTGSHEGLRDISRVTEESSTKE